MRNNNKLNMKIKMKMKKSFMMKMEMSSGKFYIFSGFSEIFMIFYYFAYLRFFIIYYENCIFKYLNNFL